jgi:tetratricopeptide (TPR) repeat protein
MAGNQNAFKKAMNAGHSAAWDQDWQKAAGLYSSALDEFPDNPLALSSLGLAYFEMQNYENSLICYQHAARVAPKDPVPQEKMARIYERIGNLPEATQFCLKAAELHLSARDVDKAIDNWQRVLALNPEHLPTRQRLAAVYERLGRHEEAVNEYLSSASILQRAGNLTTAMRAVEYATRLMPESQDARFALHTLRSNQMLPKVSRPKNAGDFGKNIAQNAQAKEIPEASKAADPIEEARQKAMSQLAGLLFDQVDEPASEPASSKRGFNMLSRGKQDALGSGSSDRSRVVLHLGQAIESISHSDEAQAATELEKALDLGLRQPPAYFILGLLNRTRAPEKAQRCVQEAIRHTDFTLGASLLSGLIYLESGQFSQAAPAFIQALALADSAMVDPQFADELRQSYEPLAESLSNETDEAVLRGICNTISTQLVRPDWRQYLMMARKQLPPQADDLPPMPVSEMILESRGSQVVEAVATVRDLAQRGMVDTAMEEAFFAMQFAPTYLPIHIQVGELLLQESRVDEAVHKFTAVGELYNARGELGRAVRMFRRILQVSPMDLAVHERLIKLLESQDKVEEALEEYMELADIYYRLAELEKARQTYMTSLKLAQKSINNRTWGVEILLKVADIDLQRLNLRQAVRIYEQIRNIQPDDPAIRSQMVLLNIRLGQDAAALSEVDAFISLLESAGRRKEAIDFINDLLVEQGSNLDLRRRLADLYAHEGRTAEAVAQLDAVAEVYMDNGKMMEAINMMETIIALKPANVNDYRTALEELRRNSLRM